MTDTKLQENLLQVAHAMADAARAAIMPHFRNSVPVENKAGGGAFDPVTVADHAAEQAMRSVLAKHRPGDGILGEEDAPVEGDTGLTWVLDPIDGTRAFISGMPTWGVLIALNDGTRPLLGVVDQPFTQERFWGSPAGAYYRHGQGETRGMSTRDIPDLAAATLFTTFPEIGTDTERKAFEAVRDRVRLTRYGTDCYAYALLAMGQLDLVIEAGLQAYDIQGPLAVVEAAGGIVTDWQGGPADQGGQVLAAANAQLHTAALGLLKDAVTSR